MKTKTNKSNPFEIKTDIVYAGRGIDSTLMTALVDQVLKLAPGDIRTSVNIPTTIAKTKKDAMNMFLNLKRTLEKSTTKGVNSIVVVSKAVHASGKGGAYQGLRVYRKA